MSGKVFYRERRKYADGCKEARHQLVAVSGVDLKVYGKHMRMSELKFIAESVGAELLLVPRGPKHQEPEEEIKVE